MLSDVIEHTFSIYYPMSFSMTHFITDDSSTLIIPVLLGLVGGTAQQKID